MSMKKHEFYIYICDTKDSTCEKCNNNNGRIFDEDNLPLIPAHPNCGCKLNKLKTIIVPDNYFNEIYSSEYYLNEDNIFPVEKGRVYRKIIIDADKTIIFDFDGNIFFIDNGRINICKISKEQYEYINLLPVNSASPLTEYLNKPINKYTDIAKPIRNEGKYLYFDYNGNEVKADMSTINGMGVLPNGKIIIGYGKNTPEYYYELYKFKLEYIELKDMMNEKPDILHTYNLSKIENQVKKMILNRKKFISNEELNDVFINNWLRTPILLMVFNL